MSFTINPTFEQMRLWSNFTLLERWQQLICERDIDGYPIPDETVKHYYKRARQNNDQVLLEVLLDYMNVPRETLTLKERICYYELLGSGNTNNTND